MGSTYSKRPAQFESPQHCQRRANPGLISSLRCGTPGEEERVRLGAVNSQIPENGEPDSSLYMQIPPVPLLTFRSSIHMLTLKPHGQKRQNMKNMMFYPTKTFVASSLEYESEPIILKLGCN